MFKPIQKQQFQGFTLIELIVLVIIFGGLAAIALPSFLNQKACACKQPAAEQYVGNLARYQQVSLLEKGHFAASMPEMAKLGAPMPTTTANYSYSIETDKTKTFIFGKTQKVSLKSYIAGVFIQPPDPKGKTHSEAIVCAAKDPGMQPISPPIDAQTCGTGTINTQRKR